MRAACLILRCSRSSSLQQALQLVVRKEAAQIRVVEATANAVNAAVALHETHRIPRQVIVDDVPGLLEVDALAQNVCRDDDVETVLVTSGWRVSRSWRKAEQGLLPPVTIAGRGGKPAPVGRQGRVALELGFEEVHDPVDRVGVVAEDEDLAHIAGFLIRNPLGMRLGCNLRQLCGERGELRVRALYNGLRVRGETQQHKPVVLGVSP